MKKVLAIFFAVVVLSMCALPAVSAATFETDPQYIYLQTPVAGDVVWSNFSAVYCHMWSKSGGDVYGWQEKAERCEDMGNGFWCYDMSGISFDENGEYSLIFSNDNGMQTYNLNITSACLGDIVYLDGETVTNPVDGEKSCAVARWRNNGDNVHPAIEIDSNGHTINIDSVDADTLVTVWGTDSGKSYQEEEIIIPTGSEDTEDTVKTDENNTATTTVGGADDEEVLISTAPVSNADGLDTGAATMWIIIGSAVVAIAVLVTVIVLAKRNKDITDGKK